MRVLASMIVDSMLNSPDDWDVYECKVPLPGYYLSDWNRPTRTEVRARNTKLDITLRLGSPVHHLAGTEVFEPCTEEESTAINSAAQFAAEYVIEESFRTGTKAVERRTCGT